jgi:hypothetical protein
MMQRKHRSRFSKRFVHEVEGAASGAIAGAAIGAVAGLQGAAAGAILGGAAGALAGRALDGRASAMAARTRELDAAIGVSGGEMGAPGLKHPPAKIGAYSSASMGTGSSAETPAEGPFEAPKD